MSASVAATTGRLKSKFFPNALTYVYSILPRPDTNMCCTSKKAASLGIHHIEEFQDLFTQPEKSGVSKYTLTFAHPVALSACFVLAH